MMIGGEGRVGSSLVLAEVDDTPRGHTDSAEVVVPATAQANDVAACVIPLCGVKLRGTRWWQREGRRPRRSAGRDGIGQ
jgi:hypothetical protein